MYRRRPYARRPRKYARKGKKGVRVSKPLRKAMTVVAKKVLARAAENKVVATLAENDVQHNFTISSADCKPLIPEISQGVLANQRVGDKITPKRLMCKGVVSLNPQQGWVTQGDIYGRILILSQKDVKVGSQVSSGSIDASHLLRPALDTSTSDEAPFSGNTEDLLYPVNTEKFRVYMDKIVKFSTTKEDSVEVIQNYSHRWSYTFKQLPTSLTYDEANGDYANNFAPFVAIGFAYSDGKPADTIQTKFITNTYARLDYEDI